MLHEISGAHLCNPGNVYANAFAIERAITIVAAYTKYIVSTLAACLNGTTILSDFSVEYDHLHVMS